MTDSHLEQDALRYRFLRSHLQFKLGGYNGPDSLKNATESDWFLETQSIFVGTDKPPRSIDEAVDAAMKEKK